MIKPSSLKDSKIAIFGLGKAGISTLNALRRAAAKIYVWDDTEAAREKLKAENLKDVAVVAPEEMPWAEIKLLALSPGIPLTHPKPHKIVELANAAKCPIVCDIELLYNACDKAKFIGITGTNGKSTTTALTGHILEKCAVKSQVGGNIGVPVLDLEPLGNDGVYVLEMSSFQLDLIKQTHFNVSVLLNITPDHLDRHGDMQGYIKAKSHIFDNQGKDDFAIIGVDDEHSQKLYESLKAEGKIAHIIPISTKSEVAGGILVQGGVIYDNTDKNSPKKYELGDLERLPGEHNGQNIAAAFSASRAVGVPAKEIISAIKSFAGLRHRIQMAAQINCIKFINDSKATNAEASANALRAYDQIYWIAGGLSKEGGISSLEEFFPRIRHAFLIGKAQDDFAKVLDGKVPYTKCDTLAKAFETSAKKALSENVEGAVVLLSPACASWDQWPNFEVRGDAFCDMSEKLEQELHLVGRNSGAL